jgi:hypothetical protein
MSIEENIHGGYGYDRAGPSCASEYLWSKLVSVVRADLPDKDRIFEIGSENGATAGMPRPRLYSPRRRHVGTGNPYRALPLSAGALDVGSAYDDLAAKYGSFGASSARSHRALLFGRENSRPFTICLLRADSPSCRPLTIATSRILRSRSPTVLTLIGHLSATAATSNSGRNERSALYFPRPASPMCASRRKDSCARNIDNRTRAQER